WSVCVDAQEPKLRDCGSALDNDCNGSPDNTADAECQCPTEGQKQACGTHPGLDGKGICSAGTQTCKGGSWSTCTGSRGPAARDCTSSADNDCDGQPDNAISGCCIASQVVASGTVDPANMCAGCDPQASKNGWSARAKCGNGDTGCTCTSYGPSETNCSD